MFIIPDIVAFPFTCSVLFGAVVFIPTLPLVVASSTPVVVLRFPTTWSVLFGLAVPIPSLLFMLSQFMLVDPASAVPADQNAICVALPDPVSVPDGQFVLQSPFRHIAGDIMFPFVHMLPLFVM